MGRSYYVVSKPLQYFNATNILDEKEKILLLVDDFFQAKRFYNEIKSNSYWKDVVFFTNIDNVEIKSWSNIYKVFQFLEKNVTEIDFVYIDNDQGTRKNIWLSKIKTQNIFVYEEGTGSYRNDLSTHGKFGILKKMLFKIFGLKHHSGGSRYVNGIYLYDLEKHKRLVSNYDNERLMFKSDFISHLYSVSSHFEFQLKEIESKIKICMNNRVLLYLSTWTFNDKIYNHLSNKNEFITFLKLHPHIKQKDNYKQFDYVINNDIFIELFILKVLEVCHELLIYHHNSSALQYIDNDKLFKFDIDIDC